MPIATDVRASRGMNSNPRRHKRLRSNALRRLYCNAIALRLKLEPQSGAIAPRGGPGQCRAGFEDITLIITLS